MGGAERVTRTIAREAARSGNFDRVDCFVLCWSRTGTLDALEDEGNVHLHYTLASSERGEEFVALLRFLRRWRYDLVFQLAYAHECPVQPDPAHWPVTHAPSDFTKIDDHV